MAALRALYAPRVYRQKDSDRRNYNGMLHEQAAMRTMRREYAIEAKKGGGIRRRAAF